VLAEVDALKARFVGQALPPAKQLLNDYSCASCGSKFEKPLKFCGECGKPMKVAQA